VKNPFLSLAAMLLAPLSVLHAADTLKIPVDSPAFVFSPGNWTGDEGRAGNRFRQTWNPGAYFRVSWETTEAKPTAKLLFDTTSYPADLKPPRIVYCIDGVWKSEIPCASGIAIENVASAGKHELCVFLSASEQRNRWGGDGKSGLNVLRVSGLEVDSGSKPIPTTPGSKWALIIGDSITEGIGASPLSCYSHLVGEALRTQGWEYGISACGWSGWLAMGDNPPGDVPGYYVVTNSKNVTGGEYDDAASRWNKIDGNRHSALDSKGHVSAYGQDGQVPSLILINYGTNDTLRHLNPSDVLGGIVQSLSALRKSAPDARIVLLIPFGQYFAAALKEAVEIHRKTHPDDGKVAIIDLGPGVAKALGVKDGFLGGVHPNDRGHAIFAARIIPQLMRILSPDLK
jgi:lysophospholipase L1-like esterase